MTGEGKMIIYENYQARTRKLDKSSGEFCFSISIMIL